MKALAMMTCMLLTVATGCGKGGDLESLRSEACACTDLDCVEAVGKKLEKFEKELTDPTPEQMKLGSEIEACMKKALFGAKKK